MLACRQKTDANTADRCYLENLAHFELRFVKSFGTSPQHAYFMPTSQLLPNLAMSPKTRVKRPRKQGQARKAPFASHSFCKSNVGTDFAFTSYDPHLAAWMALG
jgi:hypothetical protein